MTTGKITIEEKLNKEITEYFSKSHDPEIPYEVKGKITYREFLSDKLLIIVAIRAGIPYSIFNLIKHLTPFSESDWAGILNVSMKSLHRYRTEGRHNFKALHSEKIIEIAEVTQIGLEVFDDMDRLKLWLNTPNFALGKIKPIELLKDSYGKDLVLAELVRINHGILV